MSSALSLANASLVFVGAGSGGLARWLLSAGIDSYVRQHPRLDATWFPPAAILLVNVLGSMLIGYAGSKLHLEHPLRMLFIVGFCGGFTTFSTFALDSYHLFLVHGRPITAVMNIGLSVILCLGAVYLGVRLAGGSDLPAPPSQTITVNETARDE